ncbi:MAG TPA: ATP-binding protein [Solirubrobacteraceae bacterium]|nr:ATP-binding protein [Solirubrobacteraceae bacterium]
MTVPVAAPAAVRRSPYQGLVPFTEADADWFFGRDEWAAVIADNLRAYRITVLYGPSGVGKSSVLRAGLMRQLRDEARENAADVGVPRLLPVIFSAWSLDEPLTALERAVAAAGTEFVAGADGPVPGGSLASLLDRLPAQAGGPLLLVLDQLEELFLYHEGSGDATLEELSAVLRRREPSVHLLLSLREDALARLDRFEGRVPGLLDHLLGLAHLDREAAREAILAPLEHWNAVAAERGEEVSAEPALVEAVLEQVQTGKVSVGERGAGAADAREDAASVEAPYLQLVLMRLWDEERRIGSRELRVQTLHRLGGAERIVRTHLDSALAALSPREQRVAGRTFRYLVTPSGTKVAYRLGDLAEYAEVSEADLEPLVAELAGDVRVLRPAGDGRYEIYHDALAGPILDWNGRWHERMKRRRDWLRIGVLAALVVALAVIAVVIARLVGDARDAEEAARLQGSKALAEQAFAALATSPRDALQLALKARRRLRPGGGGRPARGDRRHHRPSRARRGRGRDRRLGPERRRCPPRDVRHERSDSLGRSGGSGAQHPPHQWTARLSGGIQRRRGARHDGRRRRTRGLGGRQRAAHRRRRGTPRTAARPGAELRRTHRRRRRAWEARAAPRAHGSDGGHAPGEPPRRPRVGPESGWRSSHHRRYGRHGATLEGRQRASPRGAPRATAGGTPIASRDLRRRR